MRTMLETYEVGMKDMGRLREMDFSAMDLTGIGKNSLVVATAACAKLLKASRVGAGQFRRIFAQMLQHSDFYLMSREATILLWICLSRSGKIHEHLGYDCTLLPSSPSRGVFRELQSSLPPRFSRELRWFQRLNDDAPHIHGPFGDD